MKKDSNVEMTNCILVDLKGLMKLLSCGRVAAERVGKESSAIVRVGRRKLYNLEKIKEYLNNVGGNET